MRDERDELLEEIERLLRKTASGGCPCGCDADEENAAALLLFEKARTYGVIRYPVPS